jgi:hypothetical protein
VSKLRLLLSTSVSCSSQRSVSQKTEKNSQKLKCFSVVVDQSATGFVRLRILSHVFHNSDLLFLLPLSLLSLKCFDMFALDEKLYHDKYFSFEMNYQRYAPAYDTSPVSVPGTSRVLTWKRYAAYPITKCFYPLSFFTPSSASWERHQKRSYLKKETPIIAEVSMKNN